MNNALIIQSCFSNPTSGPFYEMMRLTFPRHSAYARAHEMDYWCVMGDVTGEHMGGWDKIRLMQLALKQGYKDIAWIDADAAIADMDCDLRNALPAGKLIGLCAHDPAKSEYLRLCQVDYHLNVGVMYIRNDPRTVEFIGDWLSRHPGHPRWLEQGSFNEMAIDPKYMDMVAVIGDEWNATVNVNPVMTPFVIGWHGVQPAERRFAMMRDVLKDDFIKFRA
jgi:hypothetical protein